MSRSGTRSGALGSLGSPTSTSCFSAGGPLKGGGGGGGGRGGGGELTCIITNNPITV